MRNSSRIIAARHARAAALGVAFVSCLACAAPASAQSNSLRKRGLRSASPLPAATTQPADGAREVLLPGPYAPLRPPRSGPTERFTPNPLLLQASLIAVEVPEPRKIRVHDLITIIIREDKRSSSDAKLKSEKTWEIDAELKKWFRLDPQNHLVPQLFQDGTPGIGFDFDNQYDGKGKTERQDSLITRIQAKVIDVKPNGVLVLEATKRIDLDEDAQIITLTGECRSEDITAQNTVLSTQVANADIRVNHTGPARDAARRGWLMRTFDLLRPF